MQDIEAATGREILRHLMEMAGGSCAITEQKILEEPNPTMQEILTGLLCLHEELELRHQEVVRLSSFRRSVLRSLPVALIVCDNKRRILSTNKATQQLLGFRESDLVGQSISTVLPEIRVSASADSPQPPQTESTFLTREGNRIPVLLTRDTLHGDGDGEGEGEVFIALDIRERKKAEKKVSELNHELLLASRKAGMAEIATGVLHNVGNVLNSVNVSSELLAERARTSKLSSLKKVVELLDANSEKLGMFVTEDERGKNFHPFLRQLTGRLLVEQREALAEIGTLRGNIEHIKTIVSTQQSYAKAAGVTESCVPTDVIEDALAVERALFEKYRIEIVRDYADVPEITLDRHKILQILINLFSNARHAIRDGVESGGRITIRARMNGHGFFLIRVEDTGVGIAKENLERIFAHGFSTRENGHGFGLHNSALAAQEMGGKLTCESSGAGQGAAFALEIPLCPKGSG